MYPCVEGTIGKNNPILVIVDGTKRGAYEFYFSMIYTLVWAAILMEIIVRVFDLGQKVMFDKKKFYQLWADYKNRY